MNNYYVERDEENKVKSIFSRPQYEGQEALAEDHADIIEFFTAEQWDIFRQERNGLLRMTDFFMLSDIYSGLTAQEQSDIETYRQELRDLPGATADPYNPTWPTKPQKVIDHGI